MITLLIVLFLAFLFVLFVFLIELIFRNKNIRKELIRVAIRIFTGIFFVFLYLNFNIFYFIMIVFASFFIMVFSFVFNIFSSIHSVDRKTYGEMLFPLGVLIALWIAYPYSSVFLASLLILTLADSFATIPGFFKKSDHKTIYGSLIFFIVSFVILYLFFGSQSLYINIFISLVLTGAEYIFTYGLDDFFIPTIGSILLLAFR
ncbi:hypothetical protein M1145_03260 [Patescibacteria group bacterium]|nr:hypothetical protein [Patescibacteria group bacterium]